MRASPHSGREILWGLAPTQPSFFAYYSERLFHAFWVGRLSLKEDSRASPLDAL